MWSTKDRRRAQIVRFGVGRRRRRNEAGKAEVETKEEGTFAFVRKELGRQDGNDLRLAASKLRLTETPGGEAIDTWWS